MSTMLGLTRKIVGRLTGRGGVKKKYRQSGQFLADVENQSAMREVIAKIYSFNQRMDFVLAVYDSIIKQERPVIVVPERGHD